MMPEYIGLISQYEMELCDARVQLTCYVFRVSTSGYRGGGCDTAKLSQLVYSYPILFKNVVFIQHSRGRQLSGSGNLQALQWLSQGEPEPEGSLPRESFSSSTIDR